MDSVGEEEGMGERDKMLLEQLRDDLQSRLRSKLRQNRIQKRTESKKICVIKTKLTCREEEDAEESRSKVLAARQREREETQTQVSSSSLTIHCQPFDKTRRKNSQFIIYLGHLHLITDKVGEAQQMEAELRRELARVARDIEVKVMLVR